LKKKKKCEENHRHYPNFKNKNVKTIKKTLTKLTITEKQSQVNSYWGEIVWKSKCIFIRIDLQQIPSVVENVRLLLAVSNVYILKIYKAVNCVDLFYAFN